MSGDEGVYVGLSETDFASFAETYEADAALIRPAAYILRGAIHVAAKLIGRDKNGGGYLGRWVFLA